MIAPVLELHDVVKHYGTTKALDGVSLALPPGTYTGLLGPNGAGKSTLFQIVSGLFAADGGEVRVFGRDYRTAGPAIRARLGVVFQSRSVDLDTSVRANLRFHGRLHGLGGKALTRRIDELSEQFGLTEMLKRPARNLSGGQQRRVEIARALINDPALLIMDEPSAGLDSAARADLVAHVRALASGRSTAILWATHLVDEVENADRVIIMAKGRVVGAGTPADLITETGAGDLAGVYRSLTGAVSPVSPE